MMKKYNNSILIKICKFNGGTTHNQIPNLVNLEGSIRWLIEDKIE